LSVDTSLRQIVNQETRGAKILDVVLTNMNVYFKEPDIVPPIDVDDPTKGGVPSDHSGVVVEPRTDASRPAMKQKICRTFRPITTSSLNNIGQVFVEESWQFMDPSLPPTSLTELFEYYTGEILNIFCPTKVCYSRPNESPWVTEDMKNVKRQILREYEKKGKAVKYFALKYSYDEKLRSGVQKYRAKLQDDILSGNRNSSYAALRKLGVRSGDVTANTFTPRSH
jgi:hypothetical protein